MKIVECGLKMKEVKIECRTKMRKRTVKIVECGLKMKEVKIYILLTKNSAKHGCKRQRAAWEGQGKTSNQNAREGKLGPRPAEGGGPGGDGQGQALGRG